MLVSEPFPLRFEAGSRTDKTPRTTRSSVETSELASLLHGAVAGDAERFHCGRGGCTGPNGALVRIGEPNIIGDSATVVYSVATLTGTGKTAVPVPVRRVAFLKRLANGWKVIAYSPINGNVVAAANRVEH